MSETTDRSLLLRGITKSYETGAGGSKTVLEGIDLHIGPGELVVLLGANGSGKSTTLKIASGMIAPTAGEVRIGRTDITQMRGETRRQSRMKLGMVFQDARLIRRRSVLSNVLCGTLGRHQNIATALGFLPQSERPLAMACLERVGLGALAGQRASTLSGGQAQRVSVARALAQKPSVILADEPVASLDPESAEEVMTLLTTVARNERLAVLCVLHQIDLARRHATRLIGLKKGHIAFDLPASEVTDTMISTLYTRYAP
ncbi:phosphonate ABC transporter ATP-binding protein [Gluconobacter sp. Dm-74]|uniref:phosphonate ABC transporter ATP-binding protein n=1 Tax=Gluconobacter sp. Dm-74 TaxID=2799803 RepID=UPI001B8B679D|nr:phosphonate ABC transporter ATP-binding protein [Gluconobacter sp. Dm-74]MBS1091885.1 phosphonate ABC transporter ATP-binding protein [Gluconobacter sp. Dm-74]